jgi:4-hydroxybenzoate polyprenyltransferase
MRSDFLYEGLVRILQRRVWDFLSRWFWGAVARGQLRWQVGGRVELDVAGLPVNEHFAAWLRAQHEAGRRLVLCASSSGVDTQAGRNLAREVMERFGLFEGILVDTEPEAGPRSGARAWVHDSKERMQRLVQAFGAQGFDYAGAHGSDLPVWRQARRAIVVAPGLWLRARVARLGNLECVIERQRASLRTWVQALRLHQWSKNVLIFLAAAAAHKLLRRDIALASISAFLIFGVCASGTYLLNDLMDLDADRRHPLKRTRPFAAGTLSLAVGLWLAPTLVLASLVAAQLLLGWLFFLMLAVYVSATVWYSRSLKRIPMVDVLALAALYAVRVLAGAAATSIRPSFWLLAFTMFVFLSLAMAKRYSELKLMMAAGRQSAAGRGYTVEDAPLLLACGVAAGYNAVLVLALYVNSSVALSSYLRAEYLWLLCPLLLYWITRVWIKTARGQMDQDPVVFTLQDRPSLLVGAAGVLLVWLATVG